MNRRVPVGLLAMAFLGCARDRAELPPGPAAIRAERTPAAGLTPLDPIRSSINQGKIPADPETVRAGLVVEDPPVTPAPRKKPRPKPNMAASDALGVEAPDVPVEDKDQPRPVPAASPPTDGDADASPAPKPRPSRPGPSMSPAAPGSDLGRSTDLDSAPNTAPAAGPDIEPVPPDQPGSPATAATAAAKEGDPQALPVPRGLAPGRPLAEDAARVGDTISTMRELQYVTNDRFRSRGMNIREMPEKELSGVVLMILEDMIDNTMIIQDFRRDMKKPDQWRMFSDAFDKEWREKELPPLLKKNHVDDEMALRKLLEARGDSLDDMRELFLLEAMGRELMMMRVRPRVSKPTMTEMEAYYRKHREQYARAAAVKWREVLVPVGPSRTIAQAREKAAALRARLAAGEKFEAIAKAESEGATAKNGGLWDWSEPGSYKVAPVNAALARLRPGQVSDPIEAPGGVHLVKVEGRRTDGPAPFVEVQKEVANQVFRETFERERKLFLKKLRDRTAISMYDEKAGALVLLPRQPKTDNQAQPASYR